MSAPEDHSGGRVASAVASSAVTHLRQLEQLPEIRRIPYALCGSELEHLTHGVGDEVQPTIVAPADARVHTTPVSPGADAAATARFSTTYGKQ